MKTDILIQHLEKQNCKKCKVKGLCDQAGGKECMLLGIAAEAIKNLESILSHTDEKLDATTSRVADLEREISKVRSEREYFRSRAAFFGEVAGVTDKVISVEGFKAFRGTMRITPKASVPAYDLHGDWLYKPDTKCWYGKGSSFPEDICTIMEVMQ